MLGWVSSEMVWLGLCLLLVRFDSAGLISLFEKKCFENKGNKEILMKKLAGKN